ncbi:MAG: metallophosphatase [Candidatus Bipolaricaulis sp.]|nr:metallophosphatase [Candidatus Bipolaricaulis sp.]
MTWGVWLTVLVVLALVLIGGAVAATEITILYTNDLHLRLSRLESIAARVAAELSLSDCVLLLDVGDTWQDYRVPIFAVWGADEMVDWMNETGYDAMALGNHDFYWGARRLFALAEAADFPLLCANVVSIGGDAPPFAASARITVGGMDVLVVGLVTEEYFPYLDYPWLVPIDAAHAVRAEIDARGDGADLVVCLGHVPISDARAIASKVPGVDVFLTGHSHEETLSPVRVGGTVIVQSGAFGRSLGRLVLEVDPRSGTERVVSNELLPTDEAPASVGRGLVRLMEVLALVASVLWIVLS